MSALESQQPVLPGRLRPLAPFSGLTAEQLIVAADYACGMPYHDGEVIIQRGSVEGDDYFLLEGAVELRDAEGNVKRIDSATSAANVALASVRPSLYEVRARGISQCAKVPRQIVAVLRELGVEGNSHELSELERTLSRTQDLWFGIEADIAADRLRLPSQPELAVRLRTAIGRASCSSRMIAELLGTDPAIAAKLLKLANSPLCRGRETVTRLSDAVSRIGVHTVSELVICFSLKDLFKCEAPELRKLFAETVGEAVRVGATSSIIAERVNPALAEQALVAGLLSNVGAFPLLERLAEHADADASPLDAAAITPDLIARIGTLICRRWNFSDAVIEAVKLSYDWSYRPPEPVDLAAIVICARYHAWIGLGGRYRDGLPEPGQLPVLSILQPLQWPSDSLEIVHAAQERVDALLAALN